MVVSTEIRIGIFVKKAKYVFGISPEPIFLHWSMREIINPVFDVSLCNYFGNQKWKMCLSVLFSALLVVMDNFRSPILVFPELALRLHTIISVQLNTLSMG